MTTLKQFYEGQITMNVVWDILKGDMTPLSYVNLERIVEYVALHAKKRAGGKTAFVVLRGLEYGLSRVTNTLLDIREAPVQYEIFRSIKEANQWLVKE